MTHYDDVCTCGHPKAHHHDHPSRRCRICETCPSYELEVGGSMSHSDYVRRVQAFSSGLTDLWQLVSCPTCHAPVGLACENEDGYRQPERAQHAARVEAFYDLTEYRGQ